MEQVSFHPEVPLHRFLIRGTLLTLLLSAGLPLASLLGLGNALFNVYAFTCLLATAALACFGVLQLWRCCSAVGTIAPRLLVLLGTALLIGQTAIGMLLPVVARDALIHHLAIPAIWLKAGLPVEVSWHPWSYYPMLVQTIYTGLLPGGEEYCVLFHSLFLVLSAVTLGLLVWRMSPQSSLLSALAFFLISTTPVCLSLAETPLVDLALLFFCSGAIAALLGGSITRERMVFCGVFLGAALSTKYNGLLFTAVFVTAFPFFALQQRLTISRLVQQGLTVGLVSFLVYCPWLLRNALLTGNPFYPLLNSWFGIKKSGFSLSSVGPLAKRYYSYGESTVEIALLPLRMLLFGEEGNPRLFDGVASPVFCLIFFAFVYLLSRKSDVIFSAESRLRIGGIGFILLVYSACALYLGPARIRYMAPILGVLVLLTCVGIEWLRRYAPRVEPLLLLILIPFHLGWGMYFADTWRKAAVAYKVVSGELSVDSYKMAHPEYELIQRINAEVPAADCIELIYTSNAFYWYDGCVRSDGYQSGTFLIAAIKVSENPVQLYNTFLTRNSRYFFLHIERTRGIMADNLTAAEQKRWTTFFQHFMQLEFAGAGYGLWRILTPAEMDQKSRELSTTPNSTQR